MAYEKIGRIGIFSLEIRGARQELIKSHQRQKGLLEKGWGSIALCVHTGQGEK